MSKLKYFIPLGIFILLSAILYSGFFLEDAKVLPSQLVGKPLPEFELASVTEPGRVVRRQDLVGKVSLLNVWATWCPNCLMEHPTFLEISRRGDVQLIGINYNDDIAKAQAWLKEHQDPYALSVADVDGKLGIDLGVYGAPETFLLDAQGFIRYRYVGPVTPDVWQETLLPMIREISQAKGS